MSCYCGNTPSYALCCQPIHHDPLQAKTPEQLMRARFSAHMLQDIDFVIKTYHPSCHAEDERQAISESVHSHWQRLEVLAAEPGTTSEEGFVQFRAYFEQQGKKQCLAERSRFVRENGAWYYIDGEFIDGEFAATPKQGRNDPCACGSGKKFKKCCG
ncbi:YchJ family metal-binding protein [Vibrio misgurnus]|uniref:YchJ family metal-binding protein n=1 Tax=Vibrio misgurnus TaxID=2993714 RepID=UPI0023F9A21A|nr:YchJ family metal-binding protein [Vibrio sp. VCS]